MTDLQNGLPHVSDCPLLVVNDFVAHAYCIPLGILGWCFIVAVEHIGNGERLASVPEPQRIEILAQVGG